MGRETQGAERQGKRKRETGHWFVSLHAVCMHTNTPLKHCGQWLHRNSHGNKAKIVCLMTNRDVPWVKMCHQQMIIGWFFFNLQMHANKSHFKTAVTVIDAHSLQRWFKPQSAHWEKKLSLNWKMLFASATLVLIKGLLTTKQLEEYGRWYAVFFL